VIGAQVGNDHPHAGGHQGPGYAKADATRTAGYECNSASYVLHFIAPLA
jgi:hypothetical protein